MQVDVFAGAPLGGNPLAVVVDGDGLDDAAMAAFARWTQLSETTFLLAPSDPVADYRVRIFTPASELPFAGHPTLGSAFAWLAAGGKPRREGSVVQQCGAGLVEVRVTDTGLAFLAPPTTIEPADAVLIDDVCGALGLERSAVHEACWLDNGLRWLALRLGTASAVRALDPDHARLKVLGAKVGVIGPQPAGAETAFEVRAFVAPVGINEDPVTGSLNASLAHWLVGAGLAHPPYTVTQGTCLQRSGRIDVRSGDAGRLWIGGAVTALIDGSVSL
jgi:PhzF family phenazine biosynthesis protein